MATEAISADALYILGDLFEFWVGDDDRSSFNLHIADIIRRVSERIPVFFIHGNRDFAIGKTFANEAGFTILEEQSIIDLYGKRVLISHGDELCTQDIEYMKFRKKSRGWWWPRLALALPLRLRKKMAQRGRETSRKNKGKLAFDIMDVTQSEVDKVMQHNNVDLFIHGHTHRPNIHQFRIDDTQVKRVVLGDWYTQGSVLVASKSDLSLQVRQFSQ